MTRHEKINTVLSLIAITVALATPFVTYFWLDPTLQAFKHRGRLQISSSKDTSARHQEEIRIILGLEPEPINFDVEILNVGELPAKDIQIVAQYDSGAPQTVSLGFEPPIQYDAVTRADQVFITMKRALASKDKIKVTFRDNPSRISVSNEFGESSTVDTGLAWFKRAGELKNELGKPVNSQKPNKALQLTAR